VELYTALDALPARMPTPAEAARAEQLPAILDEIIEKIIWGDPKGARAAAQEALDEQIDIQSLINDAVVPAMQDVGDKFSRGEFFLPEMMAAALGARSILGLLRPRLAAAHSKPIARAVLGTVKGDLHDIGKNLVAMMLEGAGFEVIDLGADTTADKFITAVREHQPQIVGLSALLTTTLPMIGAIVKAMDEAGVRSQVKVLIGGAPVTQEYADKIGADGYAPNAGAAVRKAKSLLALA
jgi:5-methyltetrahydrofolate--homocysteine methyltransferase